MQHISTSQNKESAKAFYNLMFNKSEPRKAIVLYAGDEYIQHNPALEDGKVVEHWHVLQKVPGQSAYENTMF